MMMRFITCCLGLSVLFGCASTSATRYENSQEKNVTVNVNMDERGGLFSSVDVVAGVNDFDSQCQPHYQGYVELAPGENKIGLVPGVLTYLIIEIAYSSRTNSSNFSRGTMIRPSFGKQYEVDVNYADNMYDFRLYEINGAKRKELKLIPEADCKSL